MASPTEGSYAGYHSLVKGNGSINSGNTQVTGRVLYTLLTDDPVKLKEMNVTPGSIGAIEFKLISNGIEDTSSSFLVAYPKGHIKKYPVQNEIVNIVSTITKDATNPTGTNLQTYYYDDILPVFDSPEHNALPTDYTYSSNNGMSVTGPFIEKGNIYKLQHLPGDTILEGRFGNAVRFGGSSNIISDTPWIGPVGNPVTVITNGQKPQTEKGISAVFENLNEDGSSIWGLQGHQISFVPASTLFDSYNTQATDVQSKNNIIIANSPVVTPATQSLQAVDKATPVTDTPPIIYPVSVPTQTTPTPVDNDGFLPDKEDPVYNQELEDEGIPHSGGGNEVWIDLLTSIDITNQSIPPLNLSGNVNPLFLIYMLHNQGYGGFESILYYAKQGVSKIPIPSKFVTGKDKKGNYININDYMYGKKLYPNSPNSGNVGKDFNKVFGTDYTPGNFLKYWQAKFNASYNTAVSNTSLDSIFQKAIAKYPVPIEYLRFICYTESRFKSTAGNLQYKGLFSISQGQFNQVYPNDYDIYDPLKNSVVGAKITREAMGSVTKLTELLK